MLHLSDIPLPLFRRGVSDASSIEKADIAVAERAARWRDHPVVKVAGELSEAGDQPPLLALCAATIGFGLVTKRPKVALAGVRMLGAFALATAFKAGVKGAVSRTRPNVLLDKGTYEVKPLGPSSGPWASFPSGHTAGAVSVARAFAREYPQYGPYGYAAAAAVALIQVPRGSHYPLDLAGGAAIGLTAEALVDAWIGKAVQ